MSRAIIYKINKKGYLLHSNKKTVSGFSLASEPFIQISEAEANIDTITIAIKKVLTVDSEERVPDPKNWSDFSKEFLKKSRLRSSKELYKKSNFCCLIRRENENIIFTPTQHEKKIEGGFSHKNKEEITVSYTASDAEIFLMFGLALSKCE